MNRRVRPRVRRQPGTMNKTEELYAAKLGVMKHCGEIQDYRFEAMKLRLTKLTFYTPDFMVTRDDQIEFHEVKGFWEEDARVKIKMAAEIYPEFLFVAVQYKKREWVKENF